MKNHRWIQGDGKAQCKHCGTLMKHKFRKSLRGGSPVPFVVYKEKGGAWTVEGDPMPACAGAPVTTTGKLKTTKTGMTLLEAKRKAKKRTSRVAQVVE